MVSAGIDIPGSEDKVRRYEVAFFDLDHTLVDTRRQYELGLARAIDEIYGAQCPAEFPDRFLHHHEHLWGEYDRRHITMQTLRRERFLRAWRDFGTERTTAEADEFHAAYQRTFDDTLTPFADTLELLDAISKDHRLGIVTNGAPDLQWRKMEIAGIARFFAPAAVIISERIGWAKPHPSVYRAACTALGADAENAVMIGDNFNADVQGARAVGIDAIWYIPDAAMRGNAATHWPEVPLTDADGVLTQLNKLEQAR